MDTKIVVGVAAVVLVAGIAVAMRSNTPAGPGTTPAQAGASKATPAEAGDGKVKVVALRSPVMVVRPGSQEPVEMKKGDGLQSGEKITNESGDMLLAIALDATSSVTLLRAELTVTKAEPRALELAVNEGLIRIGAKAGGERFRITDANKNVIEVKSDKVVAYLQTAADGVLNVWVDEGKVKVSSGKGGSQEVVADAGLDLDNDGKFQPGVRFEDPAVWDTIDVE